MREKEVKLTPEEIVRQLYLYKLMNEYKYPKSRIRVEYEIAFGRDKKRADIVILHNDQTKKAYITESKKDKSTTELNKDAKMEEYVVIELKKPTLQEGTEQLKSYANATGAPFAVWSNGNAERICHRENPNVFTEIKRLPHSNETLEDVYNEGFTYIDLLQQDVLTKNKISLKDKILLIEDDVMAASGEDAFEEVFKLIFIKLYDELTIYRKDEGYIKEYQILEKKNSNGRFNEELKDLKEKMSNLCFAIYERDPNKLYTRMQKLFEEAKNDKKWQGIFPKDSAIALTPSHLGICVSNLQKCKFFNSNLEVIDEAFEHLANKNSKGEKGQYFTPRYVIDMCVRMLNPKENESMIDTASGSCGFPIHTCFYVWNKIYEKHGRTKSEMLTAEKKIPEAEEYVKNKVFAIDFDPRTARISKMLNLIAGDGHSNVLKLNSLDYARWSEQKTIDKTTEIFNKNFSNLEENLPEAEKTRIREKNEPHNYEKFDFDIVMANPPFAGNIKEYEVLKLYELRQSVNLEKIKEAELQKYKHVSIVNQDSTYVDMLTYPTAIVETKDGYKKIKIKEQPVVTRDILFIERNLNMLKPGGRMAIVLPQGRFNNSSDKYIREFIADKARILAVVGLHQNVFKPHTGTKTSVLFLQKWGGVDESGKELCPKVADYNIFFATMSEPSKDNSGEKIYLKKEVVSLKIQKDGKTEFKELEMQEFYKDYTSIEEANFIEYDGKRISQEEYKNLKAVEKKKILKQEAIIVQTPLLDTHGHLIVEHDLYNHDGLTKDGIAEAFIEFAKCENLSFWRDE